MTPSRLAISSPAVGVLAGLVGLGVASCAPNDALPSDGIKIGLLLPYTGDEAATSSNFERAAIMAADAVNLGGGVHGMPLRLVSRDTHSDVDRATQSKDELIAQGVTAIIGTEDADISQGILPSMVAQHVAFISPLVGSAVASAQDCAYPWFRLAPSAKALGEALAKLMFASQVTTVQILAGDDAFNTALADAAGTRFTSLGGSVTRQVVSDRDQGFGRVLNAMAQAGAQTVLVALPPVTAALAINESQTIAAFHPTWYLSPLLKTELFVQNVDPSVIEGAHGIAPAIDQTQTGYAKAFADRWHGDVPLEGARYYYDAVALVAMGMQATPLDAAAGFNFAALNASIVNVAGPPGEETDWDALPAGLQGLAAGGHFYYVGLTGPLVMSSCGERLMGMSSEWTVTRGRIVEVCSSACPSLAGNP